MGRFGKFCFLIPGFQLSIGNSGVSITLYEPRRANISKLEREAGVKFEHVSAPQPSDIAKAAGVDAAEAILHVSDRYHASF